MPLSGAVDNRPARIAVAQRRGGRETGAPQLARGGLEQRGRVAPPQTMEAEDVFGGGRSFGEGHRRRHPAGPVIGMQHVHTRMRRHKLFNHGMGRRGRACRVIDRQ